MITDQKQTGLPNGKSFNLGASPRTQLIKPNQVNNVGRNASNGGQITSGGSKFNPLRPANAASQLGAVTNSNAPSAQMGTTPSPILPSEQMNTTAAAPAAQISSVAPTTPATASPEAGAVSPASASGLENARTAIRGMSNSDIITLLNEISDGTLTGRGEV